MLIGGTAAAAGGALLGSEMAVVTLYVVGSMVGAFTGSIIGYRWHARRQHTDSLADDANSTEERPR